MDPRIASMLYKSHRNTMVENRLRQETHPRNKGQIIEREKRNIPIPTPSIFTKPFRMIAQFLRKLVAFSNKNKKAVAEKLSAPSKQ